MSVPFSLFLALKYLKPKRSVTSVVTLVSVIGVLLGVAIVIIVRAVMTGFGEIWIEKILDFRPHITLTREGSSRTIENELDLCARLEQVPGVIAALPGIELPVLAEHNGRVQPTLVFGTDSSRVRHIMNTNYMEHGTFDLDLDSAIIGIDFAARLGLVVGDDLLVYSPKNLVSKDEVYFAKRLTVTGIYETQQRDFDSKFVIISLDDARDLMSMKSGARFIRLTVTDPQDIAKFQAVISDVKALMPGYAVQTWWEFDRALMEAVATEKNMMAILLMFITIVAIFCVMNTLIVLTVQKTNEIGLLKAIGFSSWQVMATFVLHGWIQCLFGTLLGIASAFAVLHNLQDLVDFLGRCGMNVFPKDVYGLAKIPWRVVPSEVAVVVGMVIVFCTVASFLPAWRAARMDPVAALRKE